MSKERRISSLINLISSPALQIPPLAGLQHLPWHAWRPVWLCTSLYCRWSDFGKLHSTESQHLVCCLDGLLFFTRHRRILRHFQDNKIRNALESNEWQSTHQLLASWPDTSWHVSSIPMDPRCLILVHHGSTGPNQVGHVLWPCGWHFLKETGSRQVPKKEQSNQTSGCPFNSMPSSYPSTVAPSCFVSNDAQLLKSRELN